MNRETVEEGVRGRSLGAATVVAAALVFESDRDGDSEIYSVAGDGTDLVTLTDNAGYDAAASYTPSYRSA